MRLFDPNLAILAAIFKSIPEYFRAEDFKGLSNLLPAQEEVEVATMTVQEAIPVSLHDILYYDILLQHTMIS
jgi:hypothetical protein